jgi:hypothetical protein
MAVNGKITINLAEFTRRDIASAMRRRYCIRNPIAMLHRFDRLTDHRNATRSPKRALD